MNPGEVEGPTCTMWGRNCKYHHVARSNEGWCKKEKVRAKAYIVGNEVWGCAWHQYSKSKSDAPSRVMLCVCGVNDESMKKRQ